MSFHEFCIYLDVHKKTDTEVPKTAIPHSFETVEKILSTSKFEYFHAINMAYTVSLYSYFSFL